MEVREREAYGGIKTIRDGAREAYFQNHNRVDPHWQIKDFVHESLDSSYVKASDFTVEFAIDKPGWVRIECRDPFPGRDGPLVLDANLANKEEVWTEPGPNWAHVSRTIVVLLAGLFLALVVPFRLRRRLARASTMKSGRKKELLVFIVGIWWPVVFGVTAWALSNPEIIVYHSEKPYHLAVVPLLLLLIAVECSQTIAAVWPDLAPMRGRALLPIQLGSATAIGAVAMVCAFGFMERYDAIMLGAAAALAASVLALIPYMRRQSGEQSTADTLAKRLRASEAS